MTRTVKNRVITFLKPSSGFDFMLSNPPFGVIWDGKGGYEKEARKLEKPDTRRERRE